MNLDIFKFKDPSGKMYKESFLSKNYVQEYQYIIDYCVINNISDIAFKEKVYLCLNDIRSVPVCKNINCNNPVKFKNSTLGYYNYCSNRCVGMDPDIIKIKQKKSLEKFGTKTPGESLQIKNKIIKTNNEKYGGNSPMSSKEIRLKYRETIMKNFGVDNPSKSIELVKKRVEISKSL